MTSGLGYARQPLCSHVLDHVNKMASNSGPLSRLYRISVLLEMSDDDLTGLYVRIIGQLVSHDCVLCKMIIKERGDEFSVDTKYIEPFPFRLGSLFQFIGEMEKDWEKDTVAFSPKVYRCVDGLHLQLYFSVAERRDKLFPGDEGERDQMEA